MGWNSASTGMERTVAGMEGVVGGVGASKQAGNSGAISGMVVSSLASAESKAAAPTLTRVDEILIITDLVENRYPSS